MQPSKIIFKNQFPKATSLAQTPVLIFDKHLLTIPAIKTWLETFPLKISVTAGEELKQFSSFEKIFLELLNLVEKTGTKNFTLIGLGGGSVGDFVGFLSSVFKRGIPLIHIPSTWLSAIDSSHGGKTALNVGGYKNQIGTFYPAQSIYLIKPILFSQPEERTEEALGEIIKTILLEGNSLWEKTKNWKSLNSQKLWSLLPELISYKYKIVKKDPFEKKGIRFFLNFGHTFGHVLESSLKIPHGIAVNYGIRIALEFSLQKRVITKKRFDDLNKSLLIKNLLFSKESACKVINEANQFGGIKKQLLQDKKAAGKNQVNFVFLIAPGKPKVITIPNEALLKFAISQEIKEN